MQSRSRHAVDSSRRSMPELPALGPGLQLLEADDNSTGALHSLVLDHLLLNPGQAYWVDTQARIAPHHLARVAPSPRVLDRVQVARGFTPHQHYTLIERLARSVDAAVGEGPTRTAGEDTSRSDEAIESIVSLVVVPALDGLYREESDLRRGHREGQEMLLHSLAVLDRLARRHDLPVLVSLSHGDNFTAAVVRAARGTIRCEHTRFGPRFTVDSDTGIDSFETFVYPVGHGMVQTTLAFWREVLAARIPLYKRVATGANTRFAHDAGFETSSASIASGTGAGAR